MKIIAPILLVAFVATVCVKGDPLTKLAAKPNIKDFKAKQYKSMPYRLLIPDNYVKSKHYPVVLFFHGYGERGTDNEKQLKNDVGAFVKPDNREKYPCFVIVPQAPGAWIGVPIPCKSPIRAPKKLPPSIEMALEILGSVEKEYSVDKRRVYVSGCSNGACAVWCLLERKPKLWAAAVPLSGAGDPGLIAGARSIPIWDFHGEKDPTILVQRSREMIAALKAAGGKPKYTEYPGLGHGQAFIKAYTDPDLLPWMFAQERK